MGFITALFEQVCLHRPARIFSNNDRPYLYRIYLGQWFGWTAYLHHFVSADAGRWVHDHPFDGFAVVLSGGYTEERLVALSWPRLELETRRVRFFNWVAGQCFHRIRDTKANTWTLFVHGRKFKGWGFIEQDSSSDVIVYHNPYGNVGDEPWWLTAPTYGQLRAVHGGEA